MIKRTPFPKSRGCIALGVVLVALCGPHEVVADTSRSAEFQDLLIEALAETRAEADGLRARLEALSFGARDGGWTPDVLSGTLDAKVLESLRVLDVNPELRTVIFNAGSREGLRPGMRFALMRDARATAQVRLIDVRNSVSGAVMEREEPRRTVSTSDRPVLLRESR